MPALHLVVGANIRIIHIPHSHRELAIKPCRCKVSNKLLDGGVVCHQRLIAEGGVGWPDSDHGQEWQCHHPLDESETTIEMMSVNLQTIWRNTTNGSCQPTNMEQYNKWIVPTYKHGEIQQMDRVNLQTTWRNTTNGSCQPTNNMEKYNKWIVSTYKQYGKIQQMDRANLQTTYNVIPLDSCVDTVRLLQPQGLHLPPQSLVVMKEASLMARVGKLQSDRSDEA